MSMTEVIDRIKCNIQVQLDNPLAPEITNDMPNGLYTTKKGVDYEIYNESVMVEHENGYYGCLYGESSMTIYHENREVLHTGNRTINTPEALYEQLGIMPELINLMTESANKG